MSNKRTKAAGPPAPLAKPQSPEAVAGEIVRLLAARGMKIAVVGFLAGPPRSRIEDPTVEFRWFVVPLEQ